MAEDAATYRNRRIISNEADSAEGPPPGSDAWIAQVLRAICRRIEEVRKEVGRLRTERDPDRLDDLDEAADLLNVSRRTVETLIHSGELPSVKIRRRRLIPHRALKAYIRRKAEAEGDES